ncbi:MAG: hypothetical protein AB7S69_12730 [Salinivirgaceae bacterium]
MLRFGNIKYCLIAYNLPIIAILALIFRALIPYQFIVVGASLLIFTVYYVYNTSFVEITKTLKSALISVRFLFLTGLFLLIPILFSKIEVEFLHKEAFRVLSIFFIYLYLFIVIKKKGFDFFKKQFFNGFLFYILIVLLYSGYKLFILNVTLATFSSNIDFNMFALYLIMAFIIIIYKINSSNLSKIELIAYNLLLLVISVVVLFSSSRRGIILYFIIFIIILGALFFKKYKFQLIKLLPFFSLFLLMIVLSTYTISNNNIRTFITQRYIKSQSLQYKIKAIASDYLTILNRDADKIEFFNPPIIGSNIAKKLILKDYQNIKDSNEIFSIINSLALVVKSKEKLEQLIPQASIFPDSIFEKNFWPVLPENYNCDFNFQYSFIPISFRNCKLQKYNQDAFIFQAIDTYKPSSIFSFLPISDSSRFILELVYNRLDKDPSIKIFDKKRMPFSHQFLDTTIFFNDSLVKKYIGVDIYNSKENQGGIELEYFSDDFILRKINWKRVKLSNQILNTPIKTYLIEAKYIKRIKQIERLHNPANIDFTGVEKLLKSNDLIVKNQIFSNYSKSDIFQSSNTMVYFNSIGKNGAVMMKIPTIPDQEYAVSFKTNIIPNDLFYRIGRFPQVEPEFTTLRSRVTSIKQEDGLYIVNDTFRIEDCLSLRSSLIIGNKETKDSLIIKSFTYRLINSNKLIKLSPRQILGANELQRLADVATEKIHRAIQDSLLSSYDLTLNRKESDLLTNRLSHYKLGIQLFKKFRWYQKLFGNGFEYLSVYGKIFYSAEVTYGYPHNPLISSFLYSGIVGGAIYIYFLVNIVIYYFRDREKLSIFFILYLVAFLFAFFSGNSHFSIPVFAFLSVIPFLNFRKKTNE